MTRNAHRPRLVAAIALAAALFAGGAGAQGGAPAIDAAARAQFERGVALAGTQPAEAIELFEGLTRAYPGWPEPYNNLAVLYAARGEEKKAEEALIAALGTHPTYALVHRNLDALYAGMAGRAYRKALESEAGQPAPPRLALADDIGAATVVVAAAPGPAPAAAPENRSASGSTSAAPVSDGAEVITRQAAPAPAAESVAAAAQAEPSAIGSRDDARRAVLATVASWLTAWSSQDVDGYLSFYGHHFDAGDGRSRERWEAVRRKRVSDPKFIDIRIQSPKVTLEGQDRATVRFVQRYESDIFVGETVKTLRLSRGSDGWKIIREDTGG